MNRRMSNSLATAWRARLPAALVYMAYASGCGGEQNESVGRELSVVEKDSSGVRIIELSRSLYSVANGAIVTQRVTADLLIGGVEEGFGHLADVTTFPDGRIVILDRREHTAWVYDSNGVRIGRIGREGQGPGEYVRPVALASLGNYIVIMQPSPTRSLTVHDDTGISLATSPPHQAGDWTLIHQRATFPAFDRPYQTSREDWTRRLGPYDDSSFIWQVQGNEWVAKIQDEPFPYERPSAFLVRYNLAAEIVDTLAEVAAPPSIFRNLSSGTGFLIDQPMYAHRPVWTAGAGWFALGHGNQSYIEVRFLNGSQPLTILRWPNEPRSVSDDEVEAAVSWMQDLEYRFLSKGDSLRAASQRRSRREKRRLVEFHKELWSWPEMVPQIKAVYGAGSCLWLAGFSAADYADGTSLTWVVINLIDGGLQKVIRIPRRGSRVRHVDKGAIYTSFRDDMSVDYLERYTVPDLRCN